MNYDFKESNQDVLEGLLKAGLYILAGPSKVGKSVIVTSLASAVANGTSYLGRNTHQGIVIFLIMTTMLHKLKAMLKPLILNEVIN